MYKFTGFEIADLGDHQREQRIRRDVERNAQKGIRAALVQLAAELSLSARPNASHVELEQAMARGKRHPIDIRNVPGADEMPPRIGVLLQPGDQVLDLVDVPAVWRGPAPPLVTIDGSEIPILVRPFVPDGHLVVVQVADIRIAFQKPQKLMDDAPQVELLRRQARKAFRKVVAILPAENGTRAGPRTVRAVHAVVQNVLE